MGDASPAYSSDSFIRYYDETEYTARYPLYQQSIYEDGEVDIRDGKIVRETGGESNCVLRITLPKVTVHCEE